MGFFESFKVRFRGSLQSLKIFSVKLHLLRHNYRLRGSVDHSALPTEFRRSCKDAYQIDRQIQKRPPMKFCNNQKSMLVGFGLILGLYCLFLRKVLRQRRVFLFGGAISSLRMTIVLFCKWTGRTTCCRGMQIRYLPCHKKALCSCCLALQVSLQIWRKAIFQNTISNIIGSTIKRS
jgi:hypothetical protein